MPYIDQDRRFLLDPSQRELGGPNQPETVGELNFVITREVSEWIKRVGLNYTSINAAIGVLECAKLELYRRIAAPYENIQCEQNGDVF